MKLSRQRKRPLPTLQLLYGYLRHSGLVLAHFPKLNRALRWSILLAHPDGHYPSALILGSFPKFTLALAALKQIEPLADWHWHRYVDDIPHLYSTHPHLMAKVKKIVRRTRTHSWEHIHV